MAFADRLKYLRLKNNINQKDLGKIFNLSKQSISAYENGKGFPNPDTIVKLADYFNVTADYLLDRSAYDELITQWNDMQNDSLFSELNDLGAKGFVDKYGLDAFRKLAISQNNILPKNDQQIQEIVDNLQNLSLNQIEALNHLVKAMNENTAEDDGPLIAAERPLTPYGTDRIAAHRDGNPMDDLPEEAIRDVEEAKREYLAEMAQLKKDNK